MSANRATLGRLNLNVGRMLDRMKVAISVTQDAELADFLARAARRRGLAAKFRPQSICDWRGRNSITLADLVLFFAECETQGIQIKWDEIVPSLKPPQPPPPEEEAKR